MGNPKQEKQTDEPVEARLHGWFPEDNGETASDMVVTGEEIIKRGHIHGLVPEACMEPDDKDEGIDPKETLGG